MATIDYMNQFRTSKIKSKVIQKIEVQKLRCTTYESYNHTPVKITPPSTYKIDVLKEDSNFNDESLSKKMVIRIFAPLPCIAIRPPT